MTRASFIALCMLFAPMSWAQTLYKLIDRTGKVTYSEKAPEHFDGQVIPMTIDPNANTATLPKPPAPAAPQKAGPDLPKGIVVRTPAMAARENVEKARKALQEARENPSENDFRFIANAGSGTRRLPTDAYLGRVAALEEALRKAESEAAKYDESK
jgi:hypothetical protein